MLPEIIIEPLRINLERVKKIHKSDLKTGFGAVYLPYALERKYPNANQNWGWQYIFPASRRSLDSQSGVERRHHLSENVLQRAVRKLFVAAGLQNTAAVTLSGIVLPLIYGNPDMISVLFRNFWDIRMFRQL